MRRVGCPTGGAVGGGSTELAPTGHPGLTIRSRAALFDCEVREA